MTNRKALRLLELGLQPVLLGRSGEELKRPVLKGWQTAVYTAEQVAAWPRRNNLGIRCGLQPDGRALLVFDFDAEARRVFPIWIEWVRRRIAPPVVVTSGRGWHVYFYTPEPQRSQTLAARYLPVGDQETPRLEKMIETLGSGRQVVAAGSRHPNGKPYRFSRAARYRDIPSLSAAQYRALVRLSRRFDERPARPLPQATRPVAPSADLSGIHNCLDYARRYIGGEEQVERNGDIRFLGQGGLLVTGDGRGWYSFSEDTGGGLVDLMAWHQGRGAA